MLYDDQAETFDHRAGFPAEAVSAIAQSIIGLTHPHAGDRLLEIGAGTGLLSAAFLSEPIEYIGFDRSPRMIRVFHQRLATIGAQARLYVCDGNSQWPVDDRSIDFIFSSRALHHISIDHVVGETLRVLSERGGWLLTGSVGRPHDSIRSIMRREMRSRLEQAGRSGRSHERHARELFERLANEGGRMIAPIEAARWTRMVSPADSLIDWEAKSGLAGVELSEDRKKELLADLRRWAVDTYGDADRPVAQEEWYQVEGVYLGAR